MQEGAVILVPAHQRGQGFSSVLFLVPKQRNFPAYPDPEVSECVCVGRPVSDGLSSNDSTSPSSRGILTDAGSGSCLLPCSGSSVQSTVPSLCPGSSPFPVSGSAVRVVNLSPCVHVGVGSSCFFPPFVGCVSFSVSWRLVALCFFLL